MTLAHHQHHTTHHPNPKPNQTQELGSGGGGGGCTSLFLNEAALESLPWLQAALAATADDGEGGGEEAGVEGKLCCPNARCRTRLGGFNWSGSQCSCGSWVVPAVQVVASRVDRKGREETSGMVVVDFKAAAAMAAAMGAAGAAGGVAVSEKQEDEQERQQVKEEASGAAMVS